MDNQTEEFWLDGISTWDKGTGLFAISLSRANEFGPTSWYRDIYSDNGISIRKALRRDITYVDSVQTGSQIGVIAFKWIPELLADFEVVMKEVQSCGVVLCVKRCAGYGCICIAGECK